MRPGANEQASGLPPVKYWERNADGWHLFLLIVYPVAIFLKRRPGRVGAIESTGDESPVSPVAPGMKARCPRPVVASFLCMRDPIPSFPFDAAY